MLLVNEIIMMLEFLIDIAYLSSSSECIFFNKSSESLIGRTVPVSLSILNFLGIRGRRGRDRMIVGFTTTYTSSVYHH
jgi:hypothetical protein